MKEPLTVRLANALTGLTLSLLLVCGVVVASDIGIYSPPATGTRAPVGSLDELPGSISGVPRADVSVRRPKGRTPLAKSALRFSAPRDNAVRLMQRSPAQASPASQRSASVRRQLRSGYATSTEAADQTAMQRRETAQSRSFAGGRARG